MYYKVSPMVNHHTHPTDPIQDKKTNTFDPSMTSPSRQHNFAVRISYPSVALVVGGGGFHDNWDLGSQEILPSLRTLTDEAE